MNMSSNQAMESALIDTVNKELAIMQSMSEANFPCDAATTLAMRMSRAVVVSLLTMIDTLETDDTENEAISTALSTLATEARSQIGSLNERYTDKLANLSTDSIEHTIWYT